MQLAAANFNWQNWLLLLLNWKLLFITCKCHYNWQWPLIKCVTDCCHLQQKTVSYDWELINITHNWQL